jgi:hypothetical protein
LQAKLLQQQQQQWMLSQANWQDHWAQTVTHPHLQAVPGAAEAQAETVAPRLLLLLLLHTQLGPAAGSAAVAGVAAAVRQTALQGGAEAEGP